MPSALALAVCLAVGLPVTATACGPKPRPAPQALPLPPLPAAAYAHYLRGRVAFIEGDDARAIVHFRAASLAAPDEPRIFVALIEALLRAGRRDEAARHAERGQRTWPGQLEIWLVSGHVYRALGRDRDAASAFRRAVSLDRGDERGHLGLAEAHVALRRPDRAEAAYRALLSAVPDSHAGHVRLAERLLARDRHAEAEPLLRRALELEPGSVAALAALARALEALGRRGEAAALLRRAFDRSGGDPQVGERLFYQLLQTGDRAGAIALLGELDRDDLDPDTRLSFGYLYLQLGETTAAADTARALAALHPEAGAPRLLEAQALAASRRVDDALAVLLAIEPGASGYAPSRAYAAELLARAGATDRALAIAAEALARDPDHTGLITAHAFAHERTGDPRAARAILAAAVRRRPGDADLVYAWAAMEDRLGDGDRAVTIAAQVLDYDPDNVAILSFIGFSLADRDVELDRAERALSRALERAPNDALVLDGYGWLRFRQGRLAEAEEILRRAARLAPTEPEILWHLAEVTLARGRRQDALRLLERAAAIAPEAAVRARIEARIHALRTDK